MERRPWIICGTLAGVIIFSLMVLAVYSFFNVPDE